MWTYTVCTYVQAPLRLRQRHSIISTWVPMSISGSCCWRFWHTIAAAGPTPHNLCRLYDARLAHTLYASICGLVVRVITRLTKTRSNSRVSRRNEWNYTKTRSGEVFVIGQRLVNAKTNRELKSATATGLSLFISFTKRSFATPLWKKENYHSINLTKKGGNIQIYIYLVLWIYYVWSLSIGWTKKPYSRS